jgi:hypothetical protein
MISEKRVLKRRYWFTESEIETYQKFFSCSLSDIKDRFLSSGSFTGLRPYLDDLAWHPVIHNKWFTANFYPQRGVKMAGNFGFFHKIYGSTICGEKLCSQKDLDRLIRKKALSKVVIKHIGGGLGNNLLIIDHIDKTGENLDYRTVTGEVLTHKDMEELLDIMAGGLKGYIVEEKLDLHPDIEQITGKGLASVRLETLQHGQHVNKVQYAYIRLGIEGMATDHSMRKGIYVPFDLETGVMKKGLDISRPIDDQWISKHPSTGRIFEGKTVPDWPEMKDRALRAAAISPGLARVGWDFVPSSDGPRLLEGNVGGSIVIDQLMFGGFLENGVFDDWMKYLSIPKPDGSLTWRYSHWNKGRRLKPFERFVSSFLPG